MLNQNTVSFSEAQRIQFADNFLGELAQAVMVSGILTKTDNLLAFAALDNKSPNCKPSSFPCGKSCQPAKTKSGKPTQCKKALAGQAANYAAWMQMQAKNTTSASSPLQTKRADPGVIASQKTSTNQSAKLLRLGEADILDPAKVKISSRGDGGVWDVVENSAGDLFVRKQAGAFTGNHAYDGTSEILGAQILASIGSSTAKISIDGKSDQVYSKFVPGKSVESLSNDDLGAVGDKLKQGKGLMLWNNRALDVAISHPDLAKIFAFDVFSGNGDRHNGNLFYDKGKDEFHSIDNEGAFYNTWDTSVRTRIKGFIEESVAHTLSRKDLSDQEKKNLGVFKNSLEELSKIPKQDIKNASDKLFSKLDAGAYKTDPEEVKDLRTRRNEAVDSNTDFAFELIQKHQKDFERIKS